MINEEEEKNKEEEKTNKDVKSNKSQISTLSLLTIHDLKEKNKKTKFTSKSNNRWIFIKEKKDSQIQQKDNNINIKKIESHFDEEKVSKTLEKWKNLQKYIKEEISLEELMFEKQRQDNSQLKEKFRDYYKVKLQCRKEYEKIKNIDSSFKQKEKEYVLDNNIERVLLDTCEPIKNLMFLLRNNYDYTLKLISLINENDDKEKVNSLIELLCNQFYDNILIPSQNQNNLELSILIYKLLEDEIITMNSAALDDFLSDNTFIGKFLSTYVRKDEFRLFFGKIINPILSSLEKNDDDCLDLSLANIKSKISKKEKDKKRKTSNSNSPRNSEIIKGICENDIYDLSLLYKNISSTSIHFNKNEDLDEDKAPIKSNNEDSLNININNNINLDIINDNDKVKENSFSNSDNDLTTIAKKKSLAHIKEQFNNEYCEELNQEKIINKILREKNKNMKEFYIHQLEQISTNPDIYTNLGLKNIINENHLNDQISIIEKYKKNFLFIKETIDNIIQVLINKINVIPYSLKCICKIISILISKKFPKLPKFYQNSFIGKFLFDKCIFPILSLDSKNAIMNRIFSPSIKKCVNIIVNVLSNANRASLYMTNCDTEKTIFNYYLIEIIPILNEFYDELINIKLPSIIEQYVSQVDKNIKDNIDNKIFHFKRRKNPNINSNKENNDKKQNSENKDKNINNSINENNLTYDYFKENPDEIMRLQGICFSLSDAMFIYKLIIRKEYDKNDYHKNNNDNKFEINKIFKNFSKYDFFYKTVERISCDDYKLENQIKNNLDKSIYYVIFKDERNTQLEKLYMSKKQNYTSFYNDEKLDKDPSNILKRIKFCIKNILKNIELNFSFLDKATSTDKFFSAIFYELEEEEENKEILDKPPMKWYSQYIYENKSNLDIKYRKNDFQLLYEELLEEENQKLIELKNITSKIITKNNINLNCAENLINKINFSLEDILEEKKCTKLEKFIDTEEIKVCILTSKGKNNELSITIQDINKCQINNEYHNGADKNITKEKVLCHAHYIKDFINKFSYDSWEEKDRPSPSRIIWEEIRRGTRENKIYKTFKEYLEIIKKKIKEPVNNKNLFNDITDYNEIIDKIEDYIYRQIYKYIFQNKNTSNKDDNFHQTTQKFGWITPSMFDVKNISIKQLDYTIKCIQRLEDSISVNDKLNCIREAHASLNNAIKFSNGNESDAGQDEITPIFQYIIIRAQPIRIFSNINYIKTFLDESELSGSKGFLITQIESATSYIDKLNNESFKMSVDEFNEKIEKWKKINNLKIK